MKVIFEVEKDTKSTIRFKEADIGPLDTPKVGTIYVPKASLKEIGYVEGQRLEITLAVAK